jgi:hypothetical protein
MANYCLLFAVGRNSDADRYYYRTFAVQQEQAFAH